MIKFCVLCHQSLTRKIVCADCWEHLQLQPQIICKDDLTIYSAGIYQYPLNRLIQNFKYKQDIHYLPLFNRILETIDLPQFQAVVPMPISDYRLKQRGYNQAQLLAKAIAKKQNIPIWSPLIRRADHHQKNLTRAERLSGIYQQFSSCPNLSVRYRHVLIIDDVMTTGASLDAVKQQLQKIGCTKIEALCLAVVT